MSIYSKTTNNATQYKHTGSHLLDLFYAVGSSRNEEAWKNLVGLFDNAFLDDEIKACAILLWARDIRGGMGERESFRRCYAELIKNNPKLAEKVTELIPLVGRFDDLKIAFGTKLEHLALKVWSTELEGGNSLAFKWVNIKKDKVLRRYLRKNPKDFRKYIVQGRTGTIVEEKMCAGKWEEIEYGKLPSVAGARYGNAFKRHDEKRYQEFLGDDEQSINTKALYPHDVYRTIKYGDNDALGDKLWKDLPDMEIKSNILCMADVSGSMDCPASGQITCLDVSVSLALYLAQRNTGTFNNKVMTFSQSPQIINLPKDKSISKILNIISRMNWQQNTDFEAAYREILKDAKANHAKPEDMPEYLLVLSDMQFDVATRKDYRFGSRASLFNNTNSEIETSDDELPMFEHMRKEFESNGYKLPKIVFWNLNGATYGGAPACKSSDNVALISGFSPKILEAVLRDGELIPVKVMEDTIAKYVELLT